MLLLKDSRSRSGYCVKLSDFGFATKLCTQDLTAHTAAPRCTAPEVLSGNMYDPKIDLWSFGTVAYQLATGATPFRASSVKDLRRKLRMAEQRSSLPMPPHVSQAFRDLVQALLCPSPKHRLDFDAFYAHHGFTRSTKRRRWPNLKRWLSHLPCFKMLRRPCSSATTPVRHCR